MYIVNLQKNFPTLAQIQSAIKSAEIDNVKQRDQRALMYYLYRISNVSPRLKGLINVRKTALSSFNYVIAGDDKIAAETKFRLQKVINFIIQNYINAPLYGSFAGAVSYKLDNEKQHVMSFDKIFPPTELDKGFDNDIYIVSTVGSKVSKEKIELGDIRYISATDNSQSVGGVLRSIIFNEWLKDATIQEWWNYNKRLKGVVQATVADPSEKAVADSALANLMSNQYAITSDQVKFMLNQLTNSSSLDSFKEFINLLNVETAIAIVGQANTSELPDQGGSRAAVQVLNLIRNDILYSDMQIVKDVINNQVLLYDYKVNYDKNAIASPVAFDFVFDESKDVESIARMLETVSRFGLSVKADEAYKLLGLTKPESSDELLKFSNQNGLF